MVASPFSDVCGITNQVRSKVRAKVGVFIDCENVTYQYWAEVMALARSLGDVFVAEGYCRPSLKNSDNVVESSRDNKIHVFSVKKGKGYKSEIDMKMNNRIGYFQGQGRVDVFIVVASDGDYIEAIMSLRKQGKFVVGVGKEFSSKEHIRSCDVFYNLGPN